MKLSIVTPMYKDSELATDFITELIEYLKQNNINTVFHYICLHDSPYYHEKHDGREMPNAKRYEECLVRLPL